MKCEVCSSKIQTTFLGKIMGTHVKDAKGKKLIVCFECQKKFDSKEKMLEAIK
jgi:ribosome-binding protein aMBF1 (putative translation factor)